MSTSASGEMLGIACCTAWPVPSCSACSAHSTWASAKAARTCSAPLPWTTTILRGANARAVASTCPSSGRPARGCRILGSFARMALDNVARAYPRRLDQLLDAPDAEWRPGVLHPAFYGSYDWHSAVHMHWLLARLLRLHPAIPERSAIEGLLGRHLSASNIARELGFFNSPGGLTFERPYGWAWLLELQAELIRLQRWHWEVAPLADELAG